MNSTNQALKGHRVQSGFTRAALNLCIASIALVEEEALEEMTVGLAFGLALPVSGAAEAARLGRLARVRLASPETQTRLACCPLVTTRLLGGGSSL